MGRPEEEKAESGVKEKEEPHEDQSELHAQELANERSELDG